MKCKNNDILQKIKSESPFDFSKHTTYGLGGLADIAYYPRNSAEVLNVIKYVIDSGRKYVILGNGSNVLAADKRFKGCVICTKLLNNLSLQDDTLICESGVTVSKLLKFCKDNCLGGLEYLAGIPATIGGIAFMNGGVSGHYISDNVAQIEIIDLKSLKIRKLTNFECNFGYKHSTMQDINCLISKICLKVETRPKSQVEENIESYLQKRRKLPTGKSCGCVFKNYNGESAGKLIDEFNLKGLKVGRAEVSPVHANFFINYGNSAQDVYSLIHKVKRAVFEQLHINLEEEVRYIGDFDDTDS